MLEQPDGFGRPAGEDGLHAGLHGRDGLLVGDGSGGDHPLDSGASRGVGGVELKR